MAAKTSASTAFNSYFFQQQQHNQNGKQQMDMAELRDEQMPELCLKMCKKIAQLTKVRGRGVFARFVKFGKIF
jgi:hypothetical protein